MPLVWKIVTRKRISISAPEGLMLSDLPRLAELAEKHGIGPGAKLSVIRRPFSRRLYGIKISYIIEE